MVKLNQEIVTGVATDWNRDTAPSSEVRERFGAIARELIPNAEWRKFVRDTGILEKQAGSMFGAGYEAALRAHGIVTLPAESTESIASVN